MGVLGEEVLSPESRVQRRRGSGVVFLGFVVGAGKTLLEFGSSSGTQSEAPRGPWHSKLLAGVFDAPDAVGAVVDGEEGALFVGGDADEAAPDLGV